MKTFDMVVAGYQAMQPNERTKALISNALAHCRAWNASAHQFLILLALIEDCGERGYCDQSIERLAGRCLLEFDAAGKAVASLSKKGIVVLDRRSDGAIWRTIQPVQH